MPKSKPPYDPEFRRRVVELARGGQSLKELSRKFGCSEQSIRNWVNQHDVDEGRSEGVTSVEREELARLRREVAVLREERDILKKAAAWFAQESGSTPRKRSDS